MDESTPDYDVIDGNWLACTRCGATVWFSYMAIHSEWHQLNAEVTLPEDVENSNH